MTILLFLVVGELIYYLLMHSSYSERTVKKNISIDLTPTKDPRFAYAPPGFLVTPIPLTDLGMNPVTLKRIQVVTKDTLKKATVTMVEQGVIVKLSTSGGTVKMDNYEGTGLNSFDYAVELIIKGTKYRDGFLFTQDNLKVMELVEKENNKERSIGIDELKPGDEISVESTLDITKECGRKECFTSIKIVKIQY